MKRREFLKDGTIKRTSKASRHIVLDKGVGLPLFLGTDSIPEEIPVRILYREGEIIITKVV